MKTLRFNFYVDPGHGWCKVSLSLLEKLGIRDKISHYSYIRGSYAYLEEDCDFSELVRALREHGIEPKIREFCANKSSKIRSYLSYSCVTP